MKYQIVDVRRRNLLARIFSIKEWQVIVQDEEGYLYRVNAWAGVYTSKGPSWDNLLWSVEGNIKKGKLKKLKVFPEEKVMGAIIEV